MFLFPGRKSRQTRQAQRSDMDEMVARNAYMQGERTRHGGSSGPSGLSEYGVAQSHGSTRQQDSGHAAQGYGDSRAQDAPSSRGRPRRGRDGLALDGLGHRTYSPQPSALRRRFHSPENYTTSGPGQFRGQDTSSRSQYQSPPARRYAPRSNTSGNLSFDSERQFSSCPSNISSLDIGPPAVMASHGSPARKSSSTNFSVPSMKSYHSSTHGNKILGSRDSTQFFTHDISQSRNALTRVPESENQPERESPREVLRRSQRDSRVPEYARGPECAVPVESVRQRGMERYHNADGFPSWYERNLRHARPSEEERRHAGRPGRVEQQGFRKWNWGS